MSIRVIHVGGPSFLHITHGALSIERRAKPVALVPFHEINTLILDGYEITLSAALLARLATENIAVICTDEKHLPAGLLQPYSAHSLHAETLRLQTAASLPKKKRVWQQIVTAKITHQALLVAAARKPSRKLANLAAQVQSGDPTNVEGQAARLYWQLLFGPDFYRDPDAPGLNSLLNYGYAVLRASVARSLCGAGLHPALGVQHRNRSNPFALADDAIEPLRPLVDATVVRLTDNTPEPPALDPAIKRKLLTVLTSTVTVSGNPAHLADGLERYAASLRRCLCEDDRKLLIPVPHIAPILNPSPEEPC